jgi:23S rRNA pseudouridine2605 synthase
VRLQRVLAAAGVAARRAAERLIEEGRVQVNGQTVRTLPAFVDPQRDHIVVDGRPIPRQPARHVYLMLNKPARVLSVAADEPGLDRTTIMDLVKHPAAPRLFPVGRLDYETNGLVLLTNDGELANRLTHPRYGVPRRYEAVVRGALTGEALAGLQKELARLVQRESKRRMRETGRVRASAPSAGDVELALAKVEPDRSTLEITVRAGRTGDIGELLAAAGVRVKKLERTAIGPLELKGLARGRWRELERHELQGLRAAARGQPIKSQASPAPSRERKRTSRGKARTAETRGISSSSARGSKPSPAPGGRSRPASKVQRRSGQSSRSGGKR